MVVATLAVAVLALIGTLGTAFFNYRSRRVDQSLTEREQQFEFWKERVKVLEQDKKDLQMGERMNLLQAAHDKCEDRNALLERLINERLG